MAYLIKENACTSTGPCITEMAIKISANTEKKEFIAAIYTEYSLNLRKSIMRMVNCEHVAKDIVHDAFVKFSMMDNPQELEYPYAYLYRTAINLIKDRAKALRIRDDHKQSVLQDEDYGIEFKSPERCHLAQEALDIGLAAIESIPPKCRKIFLMHKVDNMSHKEITEKVGISKYTVEKHIMRAMGRCRTYLDSLQWNF